MIKDNLYAFFNKPSKKDFYELFVQLRFQISAGLSFVEACQEVGPMQPNRLVREACDRMARDMTTGSSVSKAFENTGLFSSEIFETLSAGEHSGQLSKIFAMLADKMKMESKLYGKVNNALLTPKIAGVLMFLLLTGFAKIIMPQYEKLYAESSLTMPGVLKVFLAVSNGIFDHWYLVIPLMFVMYRLWQWFISTKVYFIDSVRLKLPIYKKLHFIMLQHQFCSNLAMMIESGLLLPDACTRLADIVDNSIMNEAIKLSTKNLTAGFELGKAFERNNGKNVFDRSLLSFMSTGYRSGQLADSMRLASELYEMKLQDLVETVPTKLTVIVMAPMGFLIVGLYLLSLMPMMSYFSQISGG